MKITNDANTTIIGSNTTVVIPNSDSLMLLLLVTMVPVIESAKSVTLLLKNCSKNKLVRLNLINLSLLKSNGVLGIIASSSSYDYCYLSIYC